MENEKTLNSGILYGIFLAVMDLQPGRFKGYDSMEVFDALLEFVRMREEQVDFDQLLDCIERYAGNHPECGIMIL